MLASPDPSIARALSSLVKDGRLFALQLLRSFSSAITNISN
jgi:hypothetical protein